MSSLSIPSKLRSLLKSLGAYSVIYSLIFKVSLLFLSSYINDFLFISFLTSSYICTPFFSNLSLTFSLKSLTNLSIN